MRGALCRFVASAASLLAACGSEVVVPAGDGGSGVGAGGEATGGNPPNVGGSDGGTGGEGNGGGPLDVACLGLEQVGQAELLLQGGHAWSTAVSTDGLLVVGRGHKLEHELELHWLDPWSTWPPTKKDERGLGVNAAARMAPSTRDGVALVLNGRTLRFDVTPSSDGFAPRSPSGEIDGTITQLGDEYVVITTGNDFDVTQWRWRNAMGEVTRERTLSRCPYDDAPDAAVVRAPNGSGTWIVSEARGASADCHDFWDHPLGLYVVEDSIDAPPRILDESTRYLASNALVGKAGSLGVVFGRFEADNPQSQRFNDLYLLPLHDDGAPAAAPLPLELGLGTWQPSAVVPVANGFVVGRLAADTPAEQHVAVALFDVEGNLVEEIVTDTITFSDATGLFGHRSHDGRSIVLTWTNQKDADGDGVDELLGMRFDCIVP